MKNRANYNRFIEKGQRMYHADKKSLENALFQAFKAFLCWEEVEDFLIPILEYKLNLRNQI